MLESGGEGPEPAADDLAVAEGCDPDHHFEPHTAVARRLGGTSNLWAGRCVPFDPIDFRARPWLGLDEAWPIGPDDIAPYLAPALDALAAGEAVFEAPVGVSTDPAFRCATLERWSNVLRIQRLHARALAGRGDLAGGAALDGHRLPLPAGRRHRRARARHRGGGQGEIPASRVVLAAGGNASTRLLLLEQEREPSRFGGAGGPLGRFYMGHLSGQIADVVFENQALHDALDYHVDAHGSYVRRRLVPSDATQEEDRLANVAFWPVVPPIANAAHRSGPLSAVFLALSLAPLGRRLIAEPVRLKHVGPPPYRRAAHLRNVARDLPRTLGFAPAFLWRNRVAKMRLPGFFLHQPRPALRARVPCRAAAGPGEPADARGGARPARAAAAQASTCASAKTDAASVVRAHAALEAWLVRNRLARLEFYSGRSRGPGGGGARERQGWRAPGRDDPHGRRAGSGGGRRPLPGLRHARAPRGLDRGAADLRPGQPDAHRRPARPAPRRRPRRGRRA